MHTKIKSIVLALVAILLISSFGARAQSNKVKYKTTVSIETDPSTFLFKGYAFHFRIKPRNSKHFLIGAGAYALNLPAVMVNMNASNRNKGWKVRINDAYALFEEYYFKQPNHGLFVGLQTGIQNYKNKNDQIPGKESRYSNLLLMPSIGYNWHPFRAPFYIKPWMGIGYTTKLSGDNSIEGLTYKIAPILPFVTVHIGYTFGN